MALAPAIFREYDVRGVAGRDLNDEAAYLIGRGYATYVRAQGLAGGAVAVGRDNRPSGTGLKSALVRGLTESGLDVVDVGVVPTPALYWCVHNLDVVGGIQITGSHNPREYNGFKLGLGHRSLYGAQIQEIYRIAVAAEFVAGKGTTRREEVLDRYVDDIAARVGRIEQPLRVVVDAGNGAGALVARKLLDRIGLAGARCLYCESDGTFPNHHPDPTVPENLHDLIGAVKLEGADIGIAFDGDADRIGIVDDRGEIVWGDYLLILYARDVLARGDAGQSIIFDVKCSQALFEAVERAGGKPVMWRTGHSLIEEKMHELRAPVAGEMSGHMFFAEGWYGFDDALYGAARLLRIIADSGKNVRELLADVPRFASTPEIRIDCPDDIKFSLVERAVAHFKSLRPVIDVDGARVLFGDGWGLIRASNTQPVLVMRYEARTAERLGEIRAEMEEWLTTQGVALASASH